MDAVVLHGTPLVEDPGRVKKVRALGIDETSFLSATREHRTIYVTGLVDLDRKRIIDMVEGNAAVDLRRWCAEQDPAWMRAIRVVATDLAESYRSGTSRTSTTPSVSPTRSMWCASPTAASTRYAGVSRTRPSAIAAARLTRSIASASSCSPATNASTSGAMTASCSGFAHGDPHDELLGAWLAKEYVRDIYLTEDPKDARVLLDKAIVGCKNDEVEEIRSLGATLERWRTEILNHHRTGASNGPTEGQTCA